MRFALATAALILAADPPSAQDVLRSWVLEIDARQVDWLGDLDGDGLLDLVASDPSFGTEIAGAGTVRVYSTRAVAPGEAPVVLRQHSGNRVFEGLGRDLEVLGDVDGRRGDDYAIDGRIHDGASGALLTDLAHRFGLASTFLEPLGDVDRDGDGEVLFLGRNRVGLVLGGTFEKKLEVVIPPDLTLIEFHRLGDSNGDGAADFVVGSGYEDDFYYSGPLEAYSGRTGELLYTAEVPYEWSFGGTLAFPGDWSADGIPDLLQGGALLDGRTGTVLEPAAGLYRGEAAGDVDGDGVGDFFDGRVLLSGRTRRALLELPAPELGAAFRAGGRDWNGDGFPDLLRFQPGTRELALWSGTPSGVRALGAPCAAERDQEPRIGISGAPLLGRDVELHLSGVGPDVAAWLLIGSTVAGPMASGSGCRAEVVAASLLPARTSPLAPGIAVATAGLAIPADLALAGARTFAQWIVPSSGAAPLAATRVLELTLAIPPDFPALLRGRVRSTDGLPVAGARVQVLGQTATGVSGSDGGFELLVSPHPDPTVLVASRSASGLSGWSEPFSTSAGVTVELGEVVLDARRKQLVVGAPGPASNLGEVLALEVPPPRVLRASALPPDARLFELVWHVGGALDAHSLTALESYVRAGGGLHLSGQRSTPSVNGPVQELLDALVLAGGVRVGLASAGPYVFHPDARDQAALRPHVLGQWRAGASGAGSVTGLASPNTLVLGSSGPAGALWGSDELAGRRGQVTLLMGNAWLALPGREENVDNLRRFLRRGTRVAPR